MSHTPGPWTLEHWGDREIDVYAGEDTLVCSLRGGSTHPDDDSDADASLISAAPDLLHACELLLIYLGDWDDPEDETCVTARNAIAKAKGGE